MAKVASLILLGSRFNVTNESIFEFDLGNGFSGFQVGNVSRQVFFKIHLFYNGYQIAEFTMNNFNQKEVDIVLSSLKRL